MRVAGIGPVAAIKPTGAELEALLAVMATFRDGFRDSAETIGALWRRGGGVGAAAPPRPRGLPRRQAGFLDADTGVLLAMVASVKRGGRVDFIWVAPALRRRGLGTALVTLGGYRLPRPSHILPTAVAFWRQLQNGPQRRQGRLAPAVRS
jgi:GNAT superfamily N-acetyltransferase